MAEIVPIRDQGLGNSSYLVDLGDGRGLGSYPRYFLRLREVNRHGPRVYGATPPPLAPLSPGRDLVRQALKVGYERLAGVLAGGMAAWRAAGLPVARIEIAEVVDQPSGTVLDVRQQGEFASGHLPGARHVELGALAGAGDLPGGPLAVMCGHGERAITGASLLQRAGRGDLTVLVGGSRATRRPLEPS